MTPLPWPRRTTSPPLAADVLGDASFADEILRLTRIRTGELKLPPRIEAAYLAHTWRSRQKINVSWMGWAAAVNLVCCLFDPFLISGETVATLVARLVIALVFFAGAVAMSKLRREGPEGVITIASCGAAIVAAGVVASSPGSHELQGYVIQTMFLAGTAIVVARIAWRDTIALTAISVLLGALFLALAAPDRGLSPQTSQTIFFYGAGLVGLALGKWALKRLHYRIYVLTMSDRIRLREIETMNERLHAMARTDPLTAVANRRHFEEAFGRLRPVGDARGSVALFMIDIDLFKSLNDRLGHEAGDACLKTVAELIRGELRQSEDFLARFGGEEFVALLPDLDREAAAVVAERVRSSIEACGLPHPEGLGGVVTVSVGVALAPMGSLDRLVADADGALYAAKASGRNAVRAAWALDAEAGGPAHGRRVA